MASVVSGCSEDPGALHQGADPYGADRGETGGDPGGTPADMPGASTQPSGPAPAHDPTFAERTLARAQQWIDAAMPYCGGPNGGSDVICGGTCERTGNAQSAEWDEYRSDCSGFVSWSWALPAPGETTRTLAPYDTRVSSLITVEELAPGDALNGSGTSHVMLFGGWADKAAGKATILQESRCGTEAASKIAVFTILDTTTLQISDGRKFRPIRYNNAR